MMPRHRLDDERFDILGGTVIMRTWCHACDLPVIVTARSIARARKRAHRAIREHSGFVRAAGPGWGLAA